MQKQNNSIFIVHLNVRSSPKHIDEIANYFSESENQSEIIAISETKLSDKRIDDNITLDGYDFVHVDSSTNTGGIGYYVHNMLSFNVINNVNFSLSNAQSLWIDIKTKNDFVTLGVIYRHPVYANQQIDNFSNSLNTIFDHFNRTKCTFHVFGDFNLNLLAIQTNDTKTFFLKIYAANGFSRYMTLKNDIRRSKKF